MEETQGMEKVDTRTSLDAVVIALRDYILKKGLKPGDRLPTEAEICSSLGISRNIVREGMRHFRALGIVESRPRLGAVIRSLLPDNPFGAYLPFLLADPEGIREAAQVRLVMECGAAYLMVAKCGDEDLEYLRHQAELVANPPTNCAADIDFHRRLLEMTGNRLLMSMIPLTVEFFNRYCGAGRERDGKDIKADHDRIIAALEARDEDGLVAAFRDHYHNYQFIKELENGSAQKM